MRTLRCVLLASAVVALAACGSAPSGAPVQDYTLVLLKTGTKTQLTVDEQATIFGGHFANMERLARNGDLVLAGPFGQKRTDKALRGIFVLATGDANKAKQLAETDPGFQAGVFALEYHAVATDAALREFLAKDLAESDAIKASGRKPAPGENGRGFVLLFADDGAAARQALRGHAAVLLLGSYDERGVFAVLDAKDLAAAETALAAVRPSLGAHRLEEWFASKNLEMLRGR